MRFTLLQKVKVSMGDSMTLFAKYKSKVAKPLKDLKRNLKHRISKMLLIWSSILSADYCKQGSDLTSPCLDWSNYAPYFIATESERRVPK